MKLQTVIPAKAGIQLKNNARELRALNLILDPVSDPRGFRRSGTG
jgi:hypothetical protein